MKLKDFLNRPVDTKQTKQRLTELFGLFLNLAFCQSATTSNKNPLIHNSHPAQSFKDRGRSWVSLLRINVGSSET